jgi:hypothetical protein
MVTINSCHLVDELNNYQRKYHFSIAGYELIAWISMVGPLLIVPIVAIYVFYYVKNTNKVKLNILDINHQFQPLSYLYDSEQWRNMNIPDYPANNSSVTINGRQVDKRSSSRRNSTSTYGCMSVGDNNELPIELKVIECTIRPPSDDDSISTEQIIDSNQATTSEIGRIFTDDNHHRRPTDEMIIIDGERESGDGLSVVQLRRPSPIVLRLPSTRIIASQHLRSD